MNTKVEVDSSSLDTVKLVIAILFVASAIVGFYYFEAHSLLLRVIGLLAVSGLAVAIALQTTAGRNLWQFAADSRMEVRKVVWPTRQETIQTTLVVFLMVLVMGVMLWLFDMALFAIVRALTGQGG